MGLKEEYLQSLYQRERVIKQTSEISIEVVKNIQTGDLFIKKVLADKSLGEVYHILKNIDYLHIVKVLDCFESEMSLIVIEEYIQGQNLREHLKMPVEETTVINWIKQLCNALNFLHNQSPPIIHRDLKPSNIMLSRGQIVLIDFDIARSIKQNADSDTTLIGTSGYAPPEQYGFAQTDTRSDIYSLGILFRECLQRKQNKWESIIKKCTAIDPANRYQTIREVLTAIKRKESPVSKIALLIVATLLIGISSLAIWKFTLPESNPKVSNTVEKSVIAEPNITNPVATPDNSSPKENNQADKSIKVEQKEIPDVKQDSIKKAVESPITQKSSAITNSIEEIEKIEVVEYSNKFYAMQWLNIGYDYHYQNNDDAAIDAYSKALAIDPYYVKAYFNRGNSYKKKGQYDLALADYSKGIQINPQDADIYINRGSIYVDKDQPDLAIADFSKAIQLNPDREQAYYLRAIAYSDKKQYDLAIADLNKYIRLNPRDKVAYYNRGNFYSYQNQYELSITDYSKAIQLDSQYVSAYHNRGVSYKNIGQYDLALTDFDMTLKLNPQHTKAENERKKVLKILNKF